LTDYVSIRDLAVSAVIGVHPWEREIEQTLVVSAEMAADVRKAAASDELADALDYSAVAETIATVIVSSRKRDETRVLPRSRAVKPGFHPAVTAGG